MHAILIAISVLIVIYANIVYSIAILKGEARPHRTTRFVVLLIELLTVSTLYAQGNTTAIYLSGIYTICSLVLFGLSIKYGMGGWEKSDLICLGIAVLGIVMWKLTNNPFLGLCFSILADFAGCVPALIKTYKHPETEVWTFYGIGLLAIVINMMAIEHWTISEVIYPVYVAIINILMMYFILGHTPKKSSHVS